MNRIPVLIAGLAGGAATATGYSMPPMDMLGWLSSTEHLPEKGTPEAQNYVAQLDSELMKLPIVKQLMDDPRYEMHRAWSNMLEDKDKREKVFTAGALSRPGGLSVTPVVFINKEDRSSISVAHCGRLLTGFPVIVHGGILGTLLDEALGRTAFLSFDENEPTGVTAKLTMNYLSPTLARQFLVIRTQTDTVENSRKAWVSGTIETLKGRPLVRAQALMVVPKKYGLASMLGL